MNRALSGITPAGVMLVCMASMASVEAQSCPPLASGTYTADIPNQASGCTMGINALPPELGTGSLYCPGASAPGDVSIAAPLTPNEEGICVARIRISTSDVLMASEGEELQLGSWPGMPDPFPAESPDHVCEEAAAQGYLTSFPVLFIEATNVSTNAAGVTIFTCEGIRDRGSYTQSFGPIGDGHLWTITASEPGYQPGEQVITGTLVTEEGEAPAAGSIGRMTTPDARVESIGGSPIPLYGPITIQRAEPAY